MLARYIVVLYNSQLRTQNNFFAKEVNAVITKSEMLATLATTTGMKKKDVQTVLEAQNALLAKILKKEKKYKLQGLGIFTVRNRKARMARNPQTGDLVKVPAKTVIKFRVSKDLKTTVLGK